MSLGTSEALRELLSACLRADQVAALHTLGLHPGLINERWAGEGFEVAGSVEYVWRGDTSIMMASRGGNEALVLELVKRGAEVNARDEGWDALLYASMDGRTAVVAVLLNHGADPNTRNQHYTALGLAAAFDNLPICLLLVARAADLYAPNAVPAVGNALEGYSCSESGISPAVLEKRREALRVAFAEGPHESQFQRRREERWARRWPFMLVLVGHGFRPLQARRQEMALAMELLRLVVSEPSGGEPADAPLTRRDECVRIVFRADNLVRLIVSFL